MRAPLLSASPAAHVGIAPGGVRPVVLVLKTLYPALVKPLYPVWAHNVVIVLSHFPVTLVGSSFSACTLCTATLRRADPPYPSMPRIKLPVAPPY